MFRFRNNKKLSIEIKQQGQKYQAIIWKGNQQLNASDHFNTAAGASIAGYMLLEEYQGAPQNQDYLQERSNRACM